MLSFRFHPRLQRSLQSMCVDVCSWPSTGGQQSPLLGDPILLAFFLTTGISLNPLHPPCVFPSLLFLYSFVVPSTLKGSTSYHSLSYLEKVWQCARLQTLGIKQPSDFLLWYKAKHTVCLLQPRLHPRFSQILKCGLSSFPKKCDTPLCIFSVAKGWFVPLCRGANGTWRNEGSLKWLFLSHIPLLWAVVYSGDALGPGFLFCLWLVTVMLEFHTKGGDVSPCSE